MMQIRIEGRAAQKLEYIKNNLQSIPMYKAIGAPVRDHYQQGFRRRGAIDGRPAWRPISWMTQLLRVNAGRKFKTIEEAKIKAQKSGPLQDIGALRDSITFEVYQNKVEVGTSMRGRENQRERVVRFDFTPEKVDRLEVNMIKAFGGRPKRRGKIIKTADGVQKVLVNIPGFGLRYVNRATKNWNPEFFRALKAMAKKHNKPVHIPAREFIFISERLRSIISRAINTFYRNMLNKAERA